MARHWLVVLALLLAACGRGEVPAFHAEDITGSALGEDFRLQDGTGAARRLSEFRGQAVVVFFGYTRCPDVCPTTLARLAEVRKLLGPQGIRLQVIFISLDPERDTAAQTAAFAAFFSPSFLGLSGEPAAVAATARAFKVFYAKRDVGSAMGYAIDHFAGAFAYDPAGRLRLLIPQDEPPAQIAEDLRRLLAGQ